MCISLSCFITVSFAVCGLWRMVGAIRIFSLQRERGYTKEAKYRKMLIRTKDDHACTI